MGWKSMIRAVQNRTERTHKHVCGAVVHLLSFSPFRLRRVVELVGKIRFLPTDADEDRQKVKRASQKPKARDHVPKFQPGVG